LGKAVQIAGQAQDPLSKSVADYLKIHPMLGKTVKAGGLLKKILVGGYYGISNAHEGYVTFRKLRALSLLLSLEDIISADVSKALEESRTFEDKSASSVWIVVRNYLGKVIRETDPMNWGCSPGLSCM
jgi:hypothetical protein